MKNFKLSFSFAFLFFLTFTYAPGVPCLTNSDCFNQTEPSCCRYYNGPNPSTFPYLQGFFCATLETVALTKDDPREYAKCLANETDYKVVCADYDWECRHEGNRTATCFNRVTTYPFEFKLSEKDNEIDQYLGNCTNNWKYKK